MQSLPAPLFVAVNHLLDHAAWARKRLAPFAGQTALIKLPPFEAAFRIGGDGRISAAGDQAAIEVSICLPAATPLLALQGTDAVMRAARIDGSADFAEALGFVMRNLRWDAEEDISRIVGDIAARRIVGGSREFLAWQQQAARNLAANLAEYFTEEQPLIARQADVAEFSADIDRLRDDVARLEKRLQRLA